MVWSNRMRVHQCQRLAANSRSRISCSLDLPAIESAKRICSPPAISTNCYCGVEIPAARLSFSESSLPLICFDRELATAHRLLNNMITSFQSAQPLPILYHFLCGWVINPQVMRGARPALPYSYVSGPVNALRILEAFCYVETFPTAPASSRFDECVGARCMRLSLICSSTASWQDFRGLLRRMGHQLRRLQHRGFAKEWRGR
jgi:hypothetical protein